METFTLDRTWKKLCLEKEEKKCSKWCSKPNRKPKIFFKWPTKTSNNVNLVSWKKEQMSKMTKKDIAYALSKITFTLEYGDGSDCNDPVWDYWFQRV